MPNLFIEHSYSQYEGLSRSAEISDCGLYRWWLRRSWQSGGNGKVCCFIMLNPSTADGLEDDPTIRRCMGFVKSWGYSVLDVRNLFAWRATDPKELLVLHTGTAAGGARGDIELSVVRGADLVIAAWGASVPCNARNNGRVRQVLKLLEGTALHCLGTTASGNPRHPLYARGDLQPVPFGGVRT